MRSTRSRGFTLVELLVVVLILGALAFIAIPRIGQSSTTAKTNACKTNVDLLNAQIELYYATQGTWPSSLDVITNDPNDSYFPDGPPECPFDTAYQFNSVTHRVTEHNH